MSERVDAKSKFSETPSDRLGQLVIIFNEQNAHSRQPLIPVDCQQMRRHDWITSSASFLTNT